MADALVSMLEQDIAQPPADLAQRAEIASMMWLTYKRDDDVVQLDMLHHSVHENTSS